MGAYGLPGSIRISFGTPYENTRCMEELKRLV
jgi:histidinol-phosphate/aromatic aminotransferase/cobyric acid decarboxylase-like protein